MPPKCKPTRWHVTCMTLRKRYGLVASHLMQECLRSLENCNQQVMSTPVISIRGSGLCSAFQLPPVAFVNHGTMQDIMLKRNLKNNARLDANTLRSIYLIQLVWDLSLHGMSRVTLHLQSLPARVYHANRTGIFQKGVLSAGLVYEASNSWHWHLPW